MLFSSQLEVLYQVSQFNVQTIINILLAALIILYLWNNNNVQKRDCDELVEKHRVSIELINQRHEESIKAERIAFEKKIQKESEACNTRLEELNASFKNTELLYQKMLRDIKRGDYDVQATSSDRLDRAIDDLRGS